MGMSDSVERGKEYETADVQTESRWDLPRIRNIVTQVLKYRTEQWVIKNYSKLIISLTVLFSRSKPGGIASIIS